MLKLFLSLNIFNYNFQYLINKCKLKTLKSFIEYRPTDRQNKREKLSNSHSSIYILNYFY